MSKTVVYAGRLTSAICSDCHQRILAFNDMAAGLFDDAHRRGVVVRCVTCQAAENNKLKGVGNENI